MRVLVLGGTRFIGPAVVARLREEGHEVAIFHRGQTTAPMPAGVQQMLGNRRFLGEFGEGFRRLSPDVVLDMFPLNQKDAESVMRTFQGVAKRVVAISSCDVYRAYGRVNQSEPGPPDPVPLTEDAPLREKLYPYRGMIPGMDDYDKIVVERIVMGSPSLPGTILRLPMVYGPRDNQHRMHAYLKRMDDRRRAILLDDAAAGWRWSRGYVENVAAAIALAVTSEAAAGRIYNVAEEEALTMQDWIREIGHTADWIGEVVVVAAEHLPPHLAMGIDAKQDLVVDTTRIRRELGYAEPVPLHEAYRRTVEWEREHAPEKIDPAQFDYTKEDAALAAWRKRGV